MSRVEVYGQVAEAVGHLVRNSALAAVCEDRPGCWFRVDGLRVDVNIPDDLLDTMSTGERVLWNVAQLLAGLGVVGPLLWDIAARVDSRNRRAVHEAIGILFALTPVEAER